MLKTDNFMGCKTQHDGCLDQPSGPCPLEADLEHEHPPAPAAASCTLPSTGEQLLEPCSSVHFYSLCSPAARPPSPSSLSARGSEKNDSIYQQSPCSFFILTDHVFVFEPRGTSKNRATWFMAVSLPPRLLHVELLILWLRGKVPIVARFWFE